MRTLITTLALLILPGSVPADPPHGCCQGGEGCRGSGAAEPSPPQAPAGRGAQGGEPGMSADEHGDIFKLLSQHETVTRTVNEVPGGVRTTTTTKDPELVATLRAHVRQMARRLEQGRPVRMWDPVFREVFAHADEIHMAMRDIDGGIEVTETSENPKVVPMIRAHAAKVNDFAARGHVAARPPWAGGGRGRGRMGQGR